MMKSLKNYTINPKTIAIMPFIGENGEIYSVVIEFENDYIVEMPQRKLLEMNFKHYGSSLRGAREGTRAILGNVNLPPLTLHEASGIYLFEVKSTLAQYSVWFNLLNVVRGVQCRDGLYHVLTVDGKMIQVNMPFRKINEKIDQAYGLKGRLEKHVQFPNLVSERHGIYLSFHDQQQLNKRVNIS